MRLPSQDDLVVSLPSGKLKRWLKSDMRTMRWVFLSLYAAMLVTCFVLVFQTNESAIIAIAFLMLAAQVVFTFSSGTIQLCRPLRRRRLMLPVVTGSLMLALLTLGFFGAMIELLRLDKEMTDPYVIGFWSFIGVSWIGWGVLLFFHVAHIPRYRVIASLTTAIFAGSLAELIATVPAHIIVSRRPGCLVGLMTMLGVIAGVSVMIFSFGPMILLLFLRPRLRHETFDPTQPLCPSCGYDLRATPKRCPECGLQIERPLPAPSEGPPCATSLIRSSGAFSTEIETSSTKSGRLGS